MRDRTVLQSSAGETLAEGSEPRRYTVFVGGFPCQDLSIAGRQKGLHGERSGLHREYLAVIGSLQPDWVVTENVAHTWRRWVPELRREFHQIGYASLPLRVRASDLGAPHERARIYLVANANCELLRKLSRWWCGTGRKMADEFADYGDEKQMADAQGFGWLKEYSDEGRRSQGSRSQGNNRRGPISGRGWWSAEPELDRVAHGVSDRVERLTALGNAIVPQIAEIIAAGIAEVMK